MPLVHTTDLDGNPLSFDPLKVMAAIVSDDTLPDDAQLVGGALVLGWMHEVIRTHPDAPGASLFLAMKAADFVSYLKANPEAVTAAVQRFQTNDVVIDGQRRILGWRSPHR